MNTNIHIVCSSERGVGKTFLSKICADLLSFTENGVTVFETALPSGTSSRRCHQDRQLVNFGKMRDQVKLFDSMISEPGRNYVVDLQPEHLERFFTVLHDTAFDAGARDAGIGTGIYFFPGQSDESNSRANWIRGKLRSASLTTVLRSGKPKASYGRSGTARTVFDTKSRETLLPQLSSLSFEFAQRPDFKFGWYFNGGVARPPAEVKLEMSFFMENIREWSALVGWKETLAL